MKFTYRSFDFYLSLASALVLAQTAQAQTAQAQTAPTQTAPTQVTPVEDTGSGGEIIVTAERRATDLQKTAIAISAFTPELLE